MQLFHTLPDLDFPMFSFQNDAIIAIRQTDDSHWRTLHLQPGEFQLPIPQDRGNAI